jgi:arylformamidase
MRRIDISMPLRAGMPEFPGDPGFESVSTHALSRGDPYNVSRLALSSHAGTHIDPPSHFLPKGTSVDQIDLGILNGPCQVVEVDPRRREVGPSDLPPLPAGTVRTLFRTSNSERWEKGASFFPDYVALTLPAAVNLLQRGVRLVGIDSLSVESDPEERYPVHHLLLGGGALILEGLCLAGVAGGSYGLECLPLRWAGGDGGPARAVLTTP